MKRLMPLRYVLSSLLVFLIGVSAYFIVSNLGSGDDSIGYKVSSSAENLSNNKGITLKPSQSEREDTLSCISFQCVESKLQDLLGKGKFSESIDFVVNKSLKLNDATLCHGFMHLIGKSYGENKDRVLNQSFDLAHAESCGYGLPHGIVEYFKFGSDSKVAGEEAKVICAKISLGNTTGVYNECAHGAGHGFMNSSSNSRDYSVKSCQEAGFLGGALTQCYFGVVMIDRNTWFEREIKASDNGMKEMASFCLDSKDLEEVCLPAYAQFVVDQGIGHVKTYLAFCDRYSSRDRCFGQIALYEVLFTDRSTEGGFVDKVVKSASICVQSAVRKSELYSCLIAIPGGLSSMGYSDAEAARLGDEIIGKLWQLSKTDLRPSVIPPAAEFIR